MECSNTSIEIQTILTRIAEGDINLQPDFQRGEVWSINKKKKLIDSILRNWNIPPIHVVEGNGGIDEVLDGQQRLNSIKSFYENDFAVAGSIQPTDPNIQALDGLFFKDLPPETQRKFKKYSITVIRLTNYRAEEPAELFYRLNQPATLTAAEQRNAYIGTTRNQIKQLVYDFEKMGANKDTIGFSNSRLAYDEIISKFVFLIEERTLKKKITANDISIRYREDMPFNINTIESAKNVLQMFMSALFDRNEKFYLPKFSKATLISWFIFIKRNNSIDPHSLCEIICTFEGVREFLKGKRKNAYWYDADEIARRFLDKYNYFEAMMNIFNQRASMGSTDALSIIYRDIILELFFLMLYDKQTFIMQDINNIYASERNFGIVIDNINKGLSWGENF